MKGQNYKIIKYYDGNQTLKEIFTEIIADKVRKKFKKDMEFLKEKEYNLDYIQDDTVIDFTNNRQGVRGRPFFPMSLTRLHLIHRQAHFLYSLRNQTGDLSNRKDL